MFIFTLIDLNISDVTAHFLNANIFLDRDCHSRSHGVVTVCRGLITWSHSQLMGDNISFYAYAA